MLDCKEYSLIVKKDVQILHGDMEIKKKVLFTNGCYGLYELKCLKIQFFCWKMQILWNDVFQLFYL